VLQLNFHMKTDQIKTQKEFCDFIHLLTKSANGFDRSLEEYLSALWLLAQKHKNDELSFALLAKMLDDAFVTPAPPFDLNWLNYEEPPSELSQNYPVKNKFEFFQKMILYQIADLHRMRQEGVFETPPQFLWLGASRKGGVTWYNFEPVGFLYNALGGLEAGSNNTEYDWGNLAIQLWLGQIYE